MSDLLIVTLLIIATLIVLAAGTLITLAAVIIFRHVRRKQIRL
jgi:hypothetical protein